MKYLAPILLSATLLSACSTQVLDIEPLPGRIAAERVDRDSDTCRRLGKHASTTGSFLSLTAKECNQALSQILDQRTDLAVFDVARAYLDALHDYANALDFLEAQEETGRVASDYGAYLIARQTGLIGPMYDWRIANGKRGHPASLVKKEYMV